MRDIIKPATTLFITCLIVTLSLAFTYSATKGKIAERAEIDAENARKEVLTNADTFKKIADIDALIKENPNLALVKEAYKGVKGNDVIGYVFSTESKGYGGAIKITVGIDSKGKVAGVKLGENKETPGLGSKAADKQFISQYSDLTPKGALKVIKTKKSKPEEIEAISGATITSKAVTSAVQAAIDASGKLIQKEGGK
ncbi:MAG: electron transporter RnfG [Clostridiales bacterium]|nr:electron transporter RnfG [Clostridiales bacterium]